MVTKIDENVIEATLFSAGRPLSFEEVHDAIGVSRTQFDKLFKSLKKKYRGLDFSLEVVSIGNKYVLQLKTEYIEYIKSLATREIPMKLLKTIALIAFHQPLKQSDLKRMIGAKVYDHVPEIRELGLIRTRKEGRTKLLYITEKFNEYFGIKSKEKKDLRKILAEKAGIVFTEKEIEKETVYPSEAEDAPGDEGQGPETEDEEGEREEGPDPSSGT